MASLDDQLEKLAKEFSPKITALAKKHRAKQAFGEVLNAMLPQYILRFRKASSLKEIDKLKNAFVQEVIKTLWR